VALVDRSNFGSKDSTIKAIYEFLVITCNHSHRIPAIVISLKATPFDQPMELTTVRDR
jgi:hypothetical protein